MKTFCTLYKNSTKIFGNLMKELYETGGEKLYHHRDIWVFKYDLSTTRKIMQCKTPEKPLHKKAKMCNSQQKTMMIVFFFNIHGVFMMEWVPYHCNMNAEFNVKT